MYANGSVACQAFPLCGANPGVQRAAVHIQLTHRVIALLLVVHLFGLLMAQRKRRESPVILRAGARVVNFSSRGRNAGFPGNHRNGCSNILLASAS